MRVKSIVTVGALILLLSVSASVQGNEEIAVEEFDHMDSCTAIAAGRNATVDGSTIITHNDDSSIADFRLWIIPEADWPEGSTRDIVVHSHDYVDYGQYPPVYPEECPSGPPGATIVGSMPQVPHTYRYFHSRYSFMNEKGVAMGETTITIDTSTDYGEEVKKVMIDESDGIIDCWFSQDIGLERGSTAREAVNIMGDLVETYGWHTQWGECMDITDGDEVWIMEIYGRDIWVAFKLPDDHVFVSANRARIRDVDLDDEENVMYSPNLVSFAVEQGWYDPDSGEPFRPADVYCPSDSIYCARREWRAFDLMAPSLNLSPHELKYPQSVKTDDLLSVHDIFKIKGDYYQGTEYDSTKGPAAGPWGDPIRGSGFERSIGIHRTCYVHIAQVKGWLPDPVKGISWFGYGHPASTYLTPLWPIMRKLPEFYRTGSRYEGFRRDSGWWINIYTQRMAELCWEKAIQDIQAFRDPGMGAIYKEAAEVQEHAARLLEEHPNDQKAVNIITEFAYNTAVTWHEDWEKLGDELLSKYWAIQATRASKLPEWWLEVIDYEPPVP